ncbi:MAG: glycosyltransferase [Dethiobacter sp.]|jgi:glycosyltransferase involved in cell wall biosynthesis|nr:glycosyltransferase [Dethiobacter sp.]MBS4007460.1 glycosyltransferase [Clostridium sp.]
MEILYVSKLCSKKKFEEIFVTCHVKPQQQAQKFHHLFASGLAAQEGVQVTALSGLPISRVHNERTWWAGVSEVEDKTVFKHLPQINMALIGHIVVFVTAFLVTAKWCLVNKNKKRYIICDVLNLTISVAAKTAAKLFGVKSIAIVTDIPSFMREYKREKRCIQSLPIGIYTSLCSSFLRRYDVYIILTEQMNRFINPNSKPNIVIEGMVDLEMTGQQNLLENKYQEKIIIYAGSLHEKYGVKKLIEAFIKVSDHSARLWLLGSGDLEEEMRHFEEIDSRIKFLGVMLNKEVLEIEIKSKLLVNPRPSSEEFTKYSFPSKNMEYLASGTPLLTTKLPGMPEEYYDYVYLFEDESVEGMAKTLERILQLSKEELHAKGAAAKEFVLREKNNVVQAGRIIELIGKAEKLKHERKH